MFLQSGGAPYQVAESVGYEGLDSRFRGNDGYAVECFDAELRKSYPDSDKG